MRRSPSERYARCRLLEGASIDELRDELLNRQLDDVSTDYLVQLQTELCPPAGFSPWDRAHMASQRYLVRLGLRVFFAPDEDMRAATSLVDRASAREFAEVLLVAGADDQWLASALIRRGTPTTPRVVRLFRHFYFDIAGLDSVALPRFLARRRGEDAAGGVEDPRVRAARGRDSGLAWFMEMLRSGSLPSGVQLARLFEVARMAAAAGCVDAGLRGDASRMLAYSHVARNVSEVLTLIGDPGNDMRSELHSLMLTNDNTRVPCVAELPGSHTLDVVPAVEPEDPA